MKKTITLLLSTALLSGYGFAEPTIETTPGSKTVPAVEKPLMQQSLFDAINGAPQYTILTKALLATELNTVLEGEGPYTIFAPTDDAFGALPQETVDMLMKPENADKLASILKAHVVEGKVMAADVTAGKVVTVGGEEVEIALDDEEVTVGGALVSDTDRVTENGVIHQIDSVIIPAS